MSKNRRIPGQSISGRLFRRALVRLRIGPAPTFFARFGLSDPFTMGEGFAANAESEDGFTYLGASLYYDEVFGQAGSRARMLRRFSSQESRIQRRLMGGLTAVGPAMAQRTSAIASMLAFDDLQMIAPLGIDTPTVTEVLEPVASKSPWSHWTARSERGVRAGRASRSLVGADSFVTASAASPVEQVPALAGTPVEPLFRQASRPVGRRGVIGVMGDSASPAMSEAPALVSRSVTGRVASRVQMRAADRAILRAEVPELAERMDRSPAAVASGRAPGVRIEARRGLRRVLSASPALAMLDAVVPSVEPVSAEPMAPQATTAAISRASAHRGAPVARVAREVRSQQVTGRAGPAARLSAQAEAVPASVMRPTEWVASLVRPASNPDSTPLSTRGLRAVRVDRAELLSATLASAVRDGGRVEQESDRAQIAPSFAAVARSGSQVGRSAVAGRSAPVGAERALLRGAPVAGWQVVGSPMPGVYASVGAVRTTRLDVPDAVFAMGAPEAVEAVASTVESASATPKASSVSVKKTVRSGFRQVIGAQAVRTQAAQPSSSVVDAPVSAESGTWMAYRRPAVPAAWRAVSRSLDVVRTDGRGMAMAAPAVVAPVASSTRSSSFGSAFGVDAEVAVRRVSASVGRRLVTSSVTQRAEVVPAARRSQGLGTVSRLPSSVSGAQVEVAQSEAAVATAVARSGQAIRAIARLARANGPVVGLVAASPVGREEGSVAVAMGRMAAVSGEGLSAQRLSPSAEGRVLTFAEAGVRDEAVVEMTSTSPAPTVASVSQGAARVARRTGALVAGRVSPMIRAASRQIGASQTELAVNPARVPVASRPALTVSRRPVLATEVRNQTAATTPSTVAASRMPVVVRADAKGTPMVAPTVVNRLAGTVMEGVLARSAPGVDSEISDGQVVGRESAVSSARALGRQEHVSRRDSRGALVARPTVVVGRASIERAAQRAAVAPSTEVVRGDVVTATEGRVIGGNRAPAERSGARGVIRPQRVAASPEQVLAGRQDVALEASVDEAPIGRDRQVSALSRVAARGLESADTSSVSASPARYVSEQDGAEAVVRSRTSNKALSRSFSEVSRGATSEGRLPSMEFATTFELLERVAEGRGELQDRAVPGASVVRAVSRGVGTLRRDERNVVQLSGNPTGYVRAPGAVVRGARRSVSESALSMALAVAEPLTQGSSEPAAEVAARPVARVMSQARRQHSSVTRSVGAEVPSSEDVVRGVAGRQFAPSVSARRSRSLVGPSLTMVDGATEAVSAGLGGLRPAAAVRAAARGVAVPAVRSVMPRSSGSVATVLRYADVVEMTPASATEEVTPAAGQAGRPLVQDGPRVAQASRSSERVLASRVASVVRAAIRPESPAVGSGPVRRVLQAEQTFVERSSAVRDGAPAVVTSEGISAARLGPSRIETRITQDARGQVTRAVTTRTTAGGATSTVVLSSAQLGLPAPAEWAESRAALSQPAGTVAAGSPVVRAAHRSGPGALRTTVGATSSAQAVAGSQAGRSLPTGGRAAQRFVAGGARMSPGLGQMTLASAAPVDVDSYEANQPVRTLDARFVPARALESRGDSASNVESTPRRSSRPAMASGKRFADRYEDAFGEPSLARRAVSVDDVVGDDELTDGGKPGREGRRAVTSSAEVTRSVARSGGLAGALARASTSEEVVKVILERGDRLAHFGRELTPVMARLVQEIADKASTGADSALATNIREQMQTLVVRRSRGTREMSSSKHAALRNLQAKGSAKAVDGKGASRVTKLADKLMSLIHLAEADRRVGDAQSQVRMAETGASADAGADSKGAAQSSGEQEVLNIKALQRDVLEAVMRELELIQARGDSNEHNFWW